MSGAGEDVNLANVAMERTQSISHDSAYPKSSVVFSREEEGCTRGLRIPSLRFAPGEAGICR